MVGFGVLLFGGPQAMRAALVQRLGRELGCSTMDARVLGGGEPSLAAEPHGRPVPVSAALADAEEAAALEASMGRAGLALELAIWLRRGQEAGPEERVADRFRAAGRLHTVQALAGEELAFRALRMLVLVHTRPPSAAPWLPPLPAEVSARPTRAGAADAATGLRSPHTAAAAGLSATDDSSMRTKLAARRNDRGRDRRRQEAAGKPGSKRTTAQRRRR